MLRNHLPEIGLAIVMCQGMSKNQIGLLYDHKELERLERRYQSRTIKYVFKFNAHMITGQQR